MTAHEEPKAAHWLVGGGEMGKLIRSMDWSKTPLGPIESWSLTLRVTVNLCLASNSPMCLIWGSQRVQIYNDAYSSLCAAKHPDAIGKDYQECWFFEWCAIGSAFEQCLATGQTSCVVDQIMFKDRNGYLEETYFTLSFSPIRDEMGNAVGVFHQVNETTHLVVAQRAAFIEIERQRVEAALLESEERFRQMAETVEDVFWLSDAKQQRVLYVNPAYERVWGRSRDRLYANFNELLEAIHPDDRALTEATASRDNPAPTFDVQYRVVRPDGSVRWVHDRGTIIFDANGQPYRIAGVAQDITERKLAQAEREQLLAREQAARAEAEAANRIKDEFLAVLSHELRSPLNPILGWSKLLQTSKLDEAKTRLALSVIARNAKLQSELIEDLLDVSRILRGKLSLNTCPVDLVAIINAASETVRLAAEAKSIQILSMLVPNVCQVLGDPTRLQQVIWNLLSNAVKFSDVGGRVEIRLEQLGSQAQITVSDTGIGIHPDFLLHVFDYFRQADAATTRKFGGLGLGLAIVHHLVELHGGTVWAESPGEGLGATFTVRLPLMPIQPTVNHNLTFSEPSLDLNGVQVLLVDDDTDTREFVAFLLEQTGARAIATATASKAFAAFISFQPDVIISDIGMPDMDGYMLIRQIRTLPKDQGGEVPAIALTAYAGDFNQQLALAAGFQRHIAKPIEPKELIKTIVTLLS
ncbi:ATP-binding protein [Iningainema tapete]|uniref:Circadian input-output histidine kinase CikA n=1 Tax=Iningainema tapete BLCC-T55 TaxID=2748662 RepID=A0A8J6Y053_9CYAN|nr:ATP-binding protein [Iningainema tapete]MBD2776578.1 PAS domain-containing protein [Iningainema tapete BLCC-T55]